MALVIADRVRETTSSSGTGTVTLTGAFSGFQPFSTIGNGNTTYYCIIDAAAGAWEVGIGTYTTSGNTLSRDTVLSSSNSDALVPFATGVKDVICTQPAERAVYAVGTDVVATNNAKVPNSLLANSGITFGSTAQALGSTVTALNGVSIGGSTAAAGAFTTLTTSGAVTHNAGTANGVAYLNGSKVLTTGSALTFDGTIQGITTVASGGLRELLRLSNNGTGDGTTAQMTFYAANTNYAQITGGFFGSPALFSNVAAGGYQAWQINTLEQMRLTSTGLGIGTSSPAYKLDVSLASGSGLARFAGPEYAQVVHTDGVRGLFTQVFDNQARLFTSTATPLVFGTNDTERARIDTSGNLGLGVVPSAWGSGKAIEVGATGNGIWADSGYTDLMQNVLYSAGAYRYVRTASAARFDIENNTFRFLIAPSGTAGNAISFTQAMTLTAGGEFLIGQTATKANEYLRVSGSGQASLLLDNTGKTNGAFVGAFNDAALIGVNRNPSTGVFYNTSNRASDIVMVGSSTDSYIIFETATAANTAPTERARIDSSGNLLVGTTSAPSSSVSGVRISPLGANPAITMSAGSFTGTSTNVSFINGNGQVGSIVTDGSSTIYNTSSDYRLKNVIGAVTGSGERIDALEPVEYEWKADGSRTRGFLAHKFQEVYAGSVTGIKDAVDDEGKPVYQAMQAGSSEVIADLVAEIQSLRQRLAAAGIA